MTLHHQSATPKHSGNCGSSIVQASYLLGSIRALKKSKRSKKRASKAQQMISESGLDSFDKLFRGLYKVLVAFCGPDQGLVRALGNLETNLSSDVGNILDQGRNIPHHVRESTLSTESDIGGSAESAAGSSRQSMSKRKAVEISSDGCNFPFHVADHKRSLVNDVHESVEGAAGSIEQSVSKRKVVEIASDDSLSDTSLDPYSESSYQFLDTSVIGVEKSGACTTTSKVLEKDKYNSGNQRPAHNVPNRAPGSRCSRER